MKHVRSGWWMLAALTLVCVILAVLQFRWTAELSAAESDRLRADLASRLNLFASAINQEFNRQARDLIPTPQEMDAMGWRRAHLERLSRWQEAADPPLFATVMVARPGPSGLELYALTGKSGSPEPIAQWPPAWSDFRSLAERRLASGGRPPRLDPSLWRLTEVPLFAGDGEAAWVLFEADEEAISRRWLPALAAEHLNLEEYRYQVTALDGHLVAGEPLPQSDASAPAWPLHLGGRMGLQGAPRPGGRGPGEAMRWRIGVTHRQGSLDAAVRANRIRNLSVACILIGMIAAAGFALIRFNRQTREAAEAERRFFATVSHELRTPLTAIKSASQSLMDGSVREERQQKLYAGIIARQSENLADLVEQVLYYAASASKGPRRMAVLDPAAVLRSAAEAIAPEAGAAGCALEIDIADNLPGVTGDAASLRRMFQNLLHNAVRHGADGKRIRVELSASGNGVELRVSDFGRGLDEKGRERIFEPFFRGDRARSQQTRGAGIGLSVVRDIAALHNGRVSAGNRPDGSSGAVFTVWLPAAREETAS